jgi:hypothetical protein
VQLWGQLLRPCRVLGAATDSWSLQRQCSAAMTRSGHARLAGGATEIVSTPRLVGIKGPGSVVPTPARGRVLSPRYFDPSDHCDTAKHAHMHSVRSSLIRDDLERMQREQQARRELEKHQRRLADEVDRAVARTRPSPWLKPWDPAMTRQRRLRCGRRRMHRAAVDPMAILRRMESRMDAIRRQTPAGVSRRTSLLGRLPPGETPATGRISRDES